MGHNRILAASGLVVVLLIAWAHFEITQGEFYRFSDEEPESSLREFVMNRSVSPTIAALSRVPLSNVSTTIHLSYKEEMRENETHEVKIQYNAEMLVIDNNIRTRRMLARIIHKPCKKRGERAGRGVL